MDIEALLDIICTSHLNIYDYTRKTVLGGECDGIISHRRGEYDEYLFKFQSFQDIDFEQNIEHVQNKEKIGMWFYYDVWVRDNLPFRYYRGDAYRRQFERPRRRIEIGRNIYRYCRNSGMKFVFYFAKIYKEDLGLDDIASSYRKAAKKQKDKEKMLREIYRGYKVIFNEDTDLCRDRQFLECLDAGDIFLTDLKDFSVSEANVVVQLIKRIEGEVLSYKDICRILDTYSGELSLGEFKDKVKDYVEVSDIDTVIRDVTMNAAVLSSHRRIGKDSSLNVLPVHLLRQVGLWL
jgi:hypothetical protein